MEINFDTEDAKQAFVAREIGKGSLALDSRFLSCWTSWSRQVLVHLALREKILSLKSWRIQVCACMSKDFVRLYNTYCSGIFTGNTDASNERLFMCELKTLFRRISDKSLYEISHVV